MESPRDPLTIRPFTALLIALVPALLLARCGIWPTFPDDLRRDAGADVRDASGDSTRVDATIDAPAMDVIRDAAMDVPCHHPDRGWRAFTQAWNLRERISNACTPAVKPIQTSNAASSSSMLLSVGCVMILKIW